MQGVAMLDHLPFIVRSREPIPTYMRSSEAP